MPSAYDLPAITSTAIEDVDKFQKLPFYLVKNEVRLFPTWNIWDQLFGDISWVPNNGNTMRGVRPEASPVGRTLFYPKLLSEDPNKDVFETFESTEEMKLRWHDYQSKMFSFLPSWQDFRENQLDFNHKDIVRQVQIGNNVFIRTVVWDKSPVVMLAGKDNPSTVLAPIETGNAAQNAANSKTAAWLAANLVNVKTHLTLKVIQKAATIMSADLDVPFFEGTKNMPRPNEMIKGKYVLLCHYEDWLQFPWDTSTPNLKSINLDLLYDGFRGSLFDMVTCKFDRHPLRMNADGVFIAPQIVENPSNKTRPNPAWVNGIYAVAFLIGADGYRTVKVGPPPKDFTGLSLDKFYKMRWNGEIRLTDQFTIIRGTIAGGDYDVQLNDDGRFLKLKGTTIHGIMPGETYNVMPILYKRERVATAP